MKNARISMGTVGIVLLFIIAIIILVLLQKNKGDLGAAIKDAASFFGK